MAGAGQIPVDSYRLFAEVLSELLGFALIEHDGVEVDDGRVPWNEGLD